MGGADVGLIERLEVDHLLIGNRGFVQPALLHQDIAEEPVVENELAQRHEAPGDDFGLAEAVQLMQHVSAQQERGGIARLDGLEARRRLFGKGVEPGVVRNSRSSDKAIAKELGGARRRPPVAQVLLELRDVGVAAGRSTPLQRDRRRSGTSLPCAAPAQVVGCRLE